MDKEQFNYDEVLKKLKAGKSIVGEDGVFTPLLKQMAEALLEGEAEACLASDPEPNRRNGKTRKKLKSAAGTFELETPRDQAGTFEPQLVKKRQTTLGNEIDTGFLTPPQTFPNKLYYRSLLFNQLV